MAIVVSLIALIVVNIVVLSVAGRRCCFKKYGWIAISFVSPFQDILSSLNFFTKKVWNHYFFLISTAEENENLKKSLSYACEKNNRYNEIELSNARLRKLLNFRETISGRVLAAEVTGKDPSPWFKSIIIDKGKVDGIKKGLPVIIPEGIAGQITDVSFHYSKVQLIIDQNSAVDALVQRTRSRGIIKGEPDGSCRLYYVLRKHDIRVGETVVSSGLDGVFPKGLGIGHVSEVIKRNSGIFQEVTVTPFADYEKLEEVLVVLDHPKHAFTSKR